MPDRRILKEALRLTDAHEAFVLASVVASEGSVPGKVGASLIARIDGTFVGTVGGAGLEERVKALSSEALLRRQGGLHHFDLMGWKPGGLESRCGGSVDVAIQYISPTPNILIWGGGHVAEALARQLEILSYDHVIADDRVAFVGPDKFPAAHGRWIVPPDGLAAKVASSKERFTHAYLLGYDAKKDEEAAAALLRQGLPTVGLIASRTKRELTLRGLRARGLSEEELTRLRSPVGIPIGAESPAEIAVSIIAEIVADLHPRATEEVEEAHVAEDEHLPSKERA